MKKYLLILSLNFLLFQVNNAQMSAGFTLGGMNYQGDLVKGYVDAKEINIAYGIFIIKRFDNPKVSIKGQVQMGTISGNDANYPDRQNRGLKFTSPVSFVGTTIDYAPFAKKGYNLDFDFIPRTNVFLSGGLGFTFFNPKVQGFAQNAPDKTAEIFKLIATIPLGMGIHFDMSPEWSLSLQGSYYITSTDYLDGVSFAGTPGNNDYYFYYGLSLARKWGDKKR